MCGMELTRREWFAASLPLASLAAAPPTKSEGILALERSPHAKLRNVPVHSVKLGDGFWTPRQTSIEARVCAGGLGVLQTFSGLLGRSRIELRLLSVTRDD